MKILFLVYHGFSEASGITKKIHAQVEGLSQNGHDVRLCYYDLNDHGHFCRFIDDEVIGDYGKPPFAGIRQRLSYRCVSDYCINNGIEMVYARSFQNATPPLIALFRRLRKHGIICVTEIPTYPYDSEYKDFTYFSGRLWFKVHRLFRRRLARNMDAIVTFSAEKTIFGQRTIRISNGIDLDKTPLKTAANAASEGENTKLHLIGVAEVHFWHGFDRLIAGLGEYYAHTDSPRDICFHIVGGVAPTEMNGSIHAPGFQPLIEKYGIADHIVFHGQMFGNQLNQLFDKCHFAIGSLGRHRSGITDIKTLKNREYAARGLSFIYSENDSDFDNQPYIVKAPADESPIDVKSIISYLDNTHISPQDIRRTVEPLSWKNQMKSVIEQL